MMLAIALGLNDILNIAATGAMAGAVILKGWWFLRRARGQTRWLLWTMTGFGLIYWGLSFAWRLGAMIERAALGREPIYAITLFREWAWAYRGIGAAATFGCVLILIDLYENRGEKVVEALTDKLNGSG
jgi:hypothetical protein